MSRYDSKGLNAIDDCIRPLLGRRLKDEDGTTFAFARRWDGKQFIHERVAITGRERPFEFPTFSSDTVVRLVAGSQALALPFDGWLRLLDLLRGYGWRGAGTLAPAHHPCAALWAGEFDRPVGQRVVPRDARAMAVAAADARPDVPRLRVRVVRPGRSGRAIEWFSGTRRELILQFIRFCRDSKGFEIQPGAGLPR